MPRDSHHFNGRTGTNLNELFGLEADAQTQADEDYLRGFSAGVVAAKVFFETFAEVTGGDVSRSAMMGVIDAFREELREDVADVSAN